MCFSEGRLDFHKLNSRRASLSYTIVNTLDTALAEDLWHTGIQRGGQQDDKDIPMIIV